MQEPTQPTPAPLDPAPPPRAALDDEPFVDLGRQGLVRRLAATLRHGFGLALGALAAHATGSADEGRPAARSALLRGVALALSAGLDRRLRTQPFPVQLRVRLERLGPTYIKFGQILSLREDLLPRSVTSELRLLFDQLPALPFPQFRELVSRRLGRPADEVFDWIDPEPLGSASIGQIHQARTHDGRRVILKLVKPGVRETLRRDTLLLRGAGRLLQLFLAPYQPRRVIDEFCAYTLREVDLSREADNAEAFAAAFRGEPDIVFPKIHREYSTPTMLCMDYLEGLKPTDPRALALPLADRERLVDLGARAIIAMIYRDGFFHADLHPGNLLVLPGPRCGFIDLGMVGSFDADLKHTLMYYYYSLVGGDAESAAKYLAAIAQLGPDSNPAGFRRDVEEICRRWNQRTRFDQHSLAHLILESVARGARHRLYFPVEMVLMVKAIVTFEAVGQMLLPGFDVARVSRAHIQHILLQRFSPLHLLRETVTGLPELLDALSKTPRLLTEGLRLVEQATRKPPERPFAGLRATLFGGFCLVAGAILAAFDGPWPAWAALLLAGILLPLRRAR